MRQCTLTPDYLKRQRIDSSKSSVDLQEVSEVLNVPHKKIESPNTKFVTSHSPTIDIDSLFAKAGQTSKIKHFSSDGKSKMLQITP